MVTFDALAPGTSEASWTANIRWDAIERMAEDHDTLVVLAAHPDDETLGAAGLIARTAARGARIIVATDGEASHPRSLTLTADRLAQVRRRELLDSVQSLAPRAAISFLGLPDGQLREYSDALHQLLKAELSTVDPATTLLVAPYGGDGHRDHASASAVAREVSG